MPPCLSLQTSGRRGWHSKPLSDEHIYPHANAKTDADRNPNDEGSEKPTGETIGIEVGRIKRSTDQENDNECSGNPAAQRYQFYQHSFYQQRASYGN